MPSPSPDKPMRRRSLGPRGGHLTHPTVRRDPTRSTGGRAREGSARHCGEGVNCQAPACWPHGQHRKRSSSFCWRLTRRLQLG